MESRAAPCSEQRLVAIAKKTNEEVEGVGIDDQRIWPHPMGGPAVLQTRGRRKKIG